MKHPPLVSSHQIVELLKEKHSKDVFIPECKDGPSGVGNVRMDAWAMKKSWAHPLATGYEIKTHRGDFLHDNKWHGYLPLCNEFYFVCPGPEVITVEETGPNAGLIYVASTGNRLITKKKAPHRQVVVPEDFYRYILMCRVKIERHSFYEEQPNIKYWEEWLATKDHQLIIGHRVSKHLAKLYEEKVEQQQRRSDELQNKIDRLEKVQELVTAYGINISKWDLEQEVRRKLLNIPEDLHWAIKQMETTLQKFKSELSKIQGAKDGTEDTEQEA